MTDDKKSPEPFATDSAYETVFMATFKVQSDTSEAVSKTRQHVYKNPQL